MLSKFWLLVAVEIDRLSLANWRENLKGSGSTVTIDVLMLLGFFIFDHIYFSYIYLFDLVLLPPV